MDHHTTNIALTVYERAAHAISSLPALPRDAVPVDDACAICLVPFKDILEVEDALEEDAEEWGGRGGVTKVEGCGHMFCMQDLVEWIRNLHGSCPTCRHEFLDIRPPSESDGESSDGGEYMPGDDDEDDEEDEEEDDGFLDTDGFDVDEMDMEFDDEMDGGGAWGADGIEEWGSTDGDTPSEADMDEPLDIADIEVGIMEGASSFDGSDDPLEEPK
ncbi:hypothetical protein PLICRDRAFT_193049 [Plicaturopsis crispa FD-325 SS-3]|nr:hypothetical protein PLICRDRAFT_193049 [Plicaturopsis crispa FD-325 SS-3]